HRAARLGELRANHRRRIAHVVVRDDRTAELERPGADPAPVLHADAALRRGARRLRLQRLARRPAEHEDALRAEDAARLLADAREDPGQVEALVERLGGARDGRLAGELRAVL